MPTAFWIWLGALALLIGGGVGSASLAEDKKTADIANIAAGVGLVLLSVMTVVGLWQAWSPVDLNFTSR